MGFFVCCCLFVCFCFCFLFFVVFFVMFCFVSLVCLSALFDAISKAEVTSLD